MKIIFNNIAVIMTILLMISIVMQWGWVMFGVTAFFTGKAIEVDNE